MIGVEIRGIREVSGKLDAFGRRLDERARLNVLRAARWVQERLRARVSAPGTRDPFWGKQSVYGAAMTGRSGKTRQRITVGPLLKVFGGLVPSYSVSVGSPDPHLKLQEEGGQVEGNQFLRIPTGRAQTPAGVDINLGRSVRGLPGYRLIRTSAGRLWIVRESGGTRSGRIDFMYLLKRSVRIRRRAIFGVTRLEAEPVMGRMFAVDVSQLAARANG